MSKTVKNVVKINYKRGSGFFKRMKPVSKTKTISKTNVKKPSKLSIIEGMKSDAEKAKALKHLDNANSLRLLGTETAGSAASAITSVGAARASTTPVSFSQGSINQNIDGGAKETSNTRDDDDDPEVI